MEAVSSSNSTFSDCNRDMEHLLEAFGSSMSLESIASAYAQASSNVDLAGVILYELHGTSSVSYNSKDGMHTTSISPFDHSSEDFSNYICVAEGNGQGLPRNNISGNPGGEFLKSTDGSSTNQSLEVHPKKSLATSCSNVGKDDSMHADIEEFLFKMLGDGFQFDVKMIHEVLGLCGYDLEKSMETLVDLSASTLEKSDDVVIGCAEKEMYLKIGSISGKSESSSSQSNDRLVKPNKKESRKKNNNNCDLQREILGALFSAPERVEEVPKQPSVRTRTVYGRKAVEPVKESMVEQTFVAVKPLAGQNEVEDEDEDSFPVLRQAVKEYWGTMKEYYKAATDAYTKGDQVRAYKLMEEGQFYNRKAREADEKSAQKLLETRDDEMLLDIGTLEPKEAIKLLKFHLSSLAGIPTIRFLKVFAGDDVGENKKGCLKRLVLKLLAKESIQWNEGEDGKTIVIQLDAIDPKTLKFAKK